jgi:hypothetical protein
LYNSKSGGGSAIGIDNVILLVEEVFSQVKGTLNGAMLDIEPDERLRILLE